MISLPEYAKIKDNYCVCYFGPLDEYLLQLSLLKPAIERHFPGLRLFIGCRDDKAGAIDSADVITMSDIRQNKFLVAHVRELRFNGSTHPVEDMLIEAGISNAVVTTNSQDSHTERCVILTKGNYPTISLNDDKVNRLKAMAIKEGFVPVVDQDTHGAGLVVGVESYQLFRAASMGIRTKLIPTGVGTRLYEKMFPYGIVMHN